MARHIIGYNIKEQASMPLLENASKSLNVATVHDFLSCEDAKGLVTVVCRQCSSLIFLNHGSLRAPARAMLPFSRVCHVPCGMICQGTMSFI